MGSQGIIGYIGCNLLVAYTVEVQCNKTHYSENLSIDQIVTHAIVNKQKKKWKTPLKFFDNAISNVFHCKKRFIIMNIFRSRSVHYAEVLLYFFFAKSN